MQFKNAVYLTAMVAHLPLLFTYAINMWKKGHYQFFPLLIAVVGWLIYDRLSSQKNVGQRYSDTLPKIFLGINILLLGAAALLYSPLLIIPACIFAVAAYVVDRHGVLGFRAALPLLALLLFIIPLPANLDLYLINKMQFLASQLASWILDAFGQIHFREGVVLITDKKQFFTEEACSGIRSLFSSLSAIAIYGVIQHYSIGRHLFNILQTIVWVIVGNAIRVATVVYVSDNWTDAIATGTNHEMLGLGVFVLIFVLALSTDRAINAFNWDGEEDETDPEVDTNEFTVRPENTNKPMGAGGWAFIVAFALIFLFSGRLTYAYTTQGERRNFDDSELMESGENDLPKVIEGWEVTDFKHELRDHSGVLAPESYLWTVKKGNRVASVSLDSPYPEYHDLTFCYTSLGWDTETTHDFVPDDPNGLSKIVMSKKEQHGVVYFSGYARDGQLVIPPTQVSAAARGMAVVRNIKTVFGIADESRDFRRFLPENLLPVSQVQVMSESLDPATEQEQADLKNLFFKSRDFLLATPRFNGQ